MEAKGPTSASPTPMNRLLQGDVGSRQDGGGGGLPWLAWENGCQTALMAPRSCWPSSTPRLQGLLAGSGLVVDLLTGSMTAAQKQACRERLAAGRPTSS